MNARHRTYLVAAFEGWNDAGNASSEAVRDIVDSYDARAITAIDSDDFFNLQTNRPNLCLITGRKRIVWPQTTFYEADISPSLTLILAVGPEPDMHWQDYAASFLRVAEDADIDRMIFLSSMLEDVPHTRPLPVSVDDGADLSVTKKSYTGPIGIPTILNMMAPRYGIGSRSVWVSAPEYLGDNDCPQASLALLRKLWDMLGVTEWKDGDGIREEAADWRAEADKVVHFHKILASHLAHLEKEFDKRMRRSLDEGTGAELASEAEDFLRQLDDGSASTPPRGENGGPGGRIGRTRSGNHPEDPTDPAHPGPNDSPAD